MKNKDNAGKTLFKSLNLKLYNKSEKSYLFSKCNIWSHIINEGFYPIKFFSPGKAGTNIIIKKANGDQDLSMSYEKLKKYVNGINERFGEEIVKLNRRIPGVTKNTGVNRKASRRRSQK